jgi:hypothetical protein
MIAACGNQMDPLPRRSTACIPCRSRRGRLSFRATLVGVVHQVENLPRPRETICSAPGFDQLHAPSRRYVSLPPDGCGRTTHKRLDRPVGSAPLEEPGEHRWSSPPANVARLTTATAFALRQRHQQPFSIRCGCGAISCAGQVIQRSTLFVAVSMTASRGFSVSEVNTQRLSGEIEMRCTCPATGITARVFRPQIEHRYRPRSHVGGVALAPVRTDRQHVGFNLPGRDASDNL